MHRLIHSQDGKRPLWQQFFANPGSLDGLVGHCSNFSLCEPGPGQVAVAIERWPEMTKRLAWSGRRPFVVKAEERAPARAAAFFLRPRRFTLTNTSIQNNSSC